MDNRAADALSRKCPQPEGELLAMSTSVPAWLGELTTGYKNDAATSRILAEVSLGGSQQPNFTLKDGLLRYKGRIWVGSNVLVQRCILHSLHSVLSGDTRGFK